MPQKRTAGMIEEHPEEPRFGESFALGQQKRSPSPYRPSATIEDREAPGGEA